MDTPAKIVIVDDSPENLQVASEALSQHCACDITFATDGRQALKLIREIVPDLVLLDVIMPDMDGYAMCRQLKEDPLTTEIPVLFLTAKTESADVVSGLEAGAVDYITKPFNPPELVARVRTQLRIRQATETVALQNEALAESVAQLEANQQFLRSIIESLPYPFAVINTATHVVEMANEAFGGQQAVGQPCRTSLTNTKLPCHGDDDTWCPVKQVCITGESHAIEQEMRDDQGRLRHVEVHAYPIRDAAGRVRKVIESRFDVTQRKENEARIRELEKSESLGRMAGAVAHHYNNMMAVIMGNLEMVQQDLPAGCLAGEELMEAIRAARRAAEMGGLMLAYLGQTRAPKESVHVVKMIRRVADSVRADARPDILLEIEEPKGPVIISANREQMDHLLRALLNNAIEAIDAGGGRITVRTEMCKAADIPVAQCYPKNFKHEANDYLRLTVADDGCGMSPTDIERIFDPFYSTKFPGRGLGLAVMMSVIKANHGAVEVASQEGRGSSFSVYWPMMKDLQSVSVSHGVPADAGAAEESRAGGTVLVIEDDETVRTMSMSMLKRIGWAAVPAANGEQALALFPEQRQTIDCVICDLSMPGMDGWETISALREIDPEIPVILASGYDQASAMAGEHREMPQTFLHKPYDSIALKQALETAMATDRN